MWRAEQQYPVEHGLPFGPGKLPGQLPHNRTYGAATAYSPEERELVRHENETRAFHAEQDQKTLYEMFPTIDEALVQSVYLEACNRDLDRAINQLLIVASSAPAAS